MATEPTIIEIIVSSSPAIIEVLVPGQTGAMGSIEGAGTAALLDIHVGTTPPLNPTVNSIWIDTND
jgi:hypothetical protein